MKINQAISLVVISAVLLTGCGGTSIQTVEAAPAFPVAQSLTCSGDPMVGGGQLCDESDGSHLYWHYQFSISKRADGHGTFQIITETGIHQNSGTFSKHFDFPFKVDLSEVHVTMVFNSFCAENGLASVWKSYEFPGAEADNLIGSKDFKVGKDTREIVPLTQVVFPNPIPAQQLFLYINNDLCATSTVHWTMTGSF